MLRLDRAMLVSLAANSGSLALGLLIGGVSGAESLLPLVGEGGPA